MKAKKFVSALLALVMVLTILPMAAFAAEEEHTHDETCGCTSDVSPNSLLYDCDNGWHNLGIQETYYGYRQYSATYHHKVTLVESVCQICLYVSDSYESLTRQYHDLKPYAYVDEYEESGETWYTYKVFCNPCHYTGTLSYSTRQNLIAKPSWLT